MDHLAVLTGSAKALISTVSLCYIFCYPPDQATAGSSTFKITIIVIFTSVACFFVGLILYDLWHRYRRARRSVSNYMDRETGSEVADRRMFKMHDVSSPYMRPDAWGQ